MSFSELHQAYQINTFVNYVYLIQAEIKSFFTSFRKSHDFFGIHAGIVIARNLIHPVNPWPRPVVNIAGSTIGFIKKK